MGHDHGTDMHHTTHSTIYYVTYRVESGDRMELAFQGTGYLGPARAV